MVGYAIVAILGIVIGFVLAGWKISRDYRQLREKLEFEEELRLKEDGWLQDDAEREGGTEHA